MLETIQYKLFLALLLGAAIGFERESNAKGRSYLLGGGVRTFSLVSLIGFLSGNFYQNSQYVAASILSLAFVSLIIVYYSIHARATKSLGLTTEMAYIVTFSFGVLLSGAFLSTQLIVALAVVVLLILSLKEESQKLIAQVSRGQVESFIAYAIIALVVLPFLSTTSYKVADFPLLLSSLGSLGLDPSKLGEVQLINPSKLWFIVVLVTGIDVLGFVLTKLLGSKRGFAVASFFAGFVSSTSTTQSLALRSKTVTKNYHLVGAALLANLASFFQIFLLVGPLNIVLLKTLFPTLGFLILTAGILSYLYLKKDPGNHSNSSGNKDKPIFSLIPAIKFATLILVVKILTSLSLVFFGKAGFLISSVLASFAGIDAVLVNLASLAGTDITFKFALLVFILVNAANLLSKSLYTYLQGSKQFSKNFSLSIALLILASLLGFLFQ